MKFFLSKMLLVVLVVLLVSNGYSSLCQSLMGDNICFMKCCNEMSQTPSSCHQVVGKNSQGIQTASKSLDIKEVGKILTYQPIYQTEIGLKLDPYFKPLHPPLIILKQSFRC